MLIDSADYEATLAENAALKSRLETIECSRDLGLFVRLLEELRGEEFFGILSSCRSGKPCHGFYFTARDSSNDLYEKRKAIFLELSARANEGANKPPTKGNI